MLAHGQGTLLNASRLAAGLSVSVPTIVRYIDLLVDLLLVRRLPPFHANTGNRLVKSPKIYVRDSGILHALLGIKDHKGVALFKPTAPITPVARVGSFAPLRVCEYIGRRKPQKRT